METAMQDIGNTQINSPGWVVFVKVSFVISIIAMFAGIVFAQTDLMVKGFLGMGTLYLIASTFTLSKTIRDEFEGQKLISKLAEAEVQKLLKEYGK
jgi:hypothetical protein